MSNVEETEKKQCKVRKREGEREYEREKYIYFAKKVMWKESERERELIRCCIFWKLNLFNKQKIPWLLL